MAQTPLPEEIENWVRFQIRQLNPSAERTVAGYLARHGLKELPLPEYVSADMCYVYKPQRDAAKQIIGYSKVTHRGLPESLLIALEKDFLLAPPVLADTASETAVEVSSGPDSRAAQATPFDESSTEPEKEPEKAPEDSEPPEDDSEQGVYKCERRWASNHKLCGRTYQTKGRLLAHIKKSHSAEG